MSNENKRCRNCRHYLPWASGENGECLFRFPETVRAPGMNGARKLPDDWCDLFNSRAAE